MLKITLALLFSISTALAGEFPQTEISNGVLHAKLYLPDAQQGYYRGTRFDWSGVIFSLQYQNHEYFGPWFEKHDPKIHDAITGPVEEFLTNHAGLGYDEVKTGETFLRIGVGTVRKPEEKAYRRFHTYEIVDPGRWSLSKGKDWVEFRQELRDDSGYAYIYSKRIQLEKSPARLLLEHTLQNTGRRTIETQQYNHNFFTIDRQPTGPTFLVQFPFEVHALQDLRDIAKVSGRSLEYLREMETGQSLFTELSGFGNSPKDYDFRIENRQTRAGVRIRGDYPLVRLVFWCIRKTLCPEPYILIRVAPGKVSRWKLQYEFYTF